MQGFSRKVSGGYGDSARSGQFTLHRAGIQARMADYLFFVFPDEPVHGDTGCRGGGEGEKHEKESQPENELIESRAGSVGAPSPSAPFRGVAGVSEKSVKRRVKPEAARRRSGGRADLRRRAPSGQSFFEGDEEVEEAEEEESDFFDSFDSLEELLEPFFESPFEFEDSVFVAESVLAAGSALLFPE